MNKDSVIDFLGYLGFRLLGPVIRLLPKRVSLGLGSKLGELMYYFGYKHRAVTYANIKTALGAKLSPGELKRITKRFYRVYGQNILEIFLIPLVDENYINKYIEVEGIKYIRQGFEKGKGVILLGMHVGSWELSNIICANLGFDFTLFIRDQGFPRLNSLLNNYRQRLGCKIIQRKNGVRQLIELIKKNKAIGMTADQGGKGGIQVKFFGKETSMPYGAVRFALKYGAAILPAFYTRVSGPYIKTIIEPPFEVKKTGNLDKDVRDNLQALIGVFERLIGKYPQEYLWSYKIWKYSRRRGLLILSDGKAGHLRQSQFIAQAMEEGLRSRGIELDTHTVEVRFKNKFSRQALLSSSLLSGRYACQGCLWCLRHFLTEDSYKVLTALSADYIVSSGSSLAAVNFVISRENNAKSIVNMRPSVLSANRFDLVIMPRHDLPPKRKNIVVTEGVLNVIGRDYLKQQAEDLSAACGLRQVSGNAIGLLIGGDSKNFCLKEETLSRLIKEVKSASLAVKADVLVSTSRRTPARLEKLIKDEFTDFPNCKILIIANEKNFPSAVGGILGLSKLVVVSPESISMVCEAVAGEKYVLVFNSPGLRLRHRRFLDYFSQKKYITLSRPEDIALNIERIFRMKPAVVPLKDKPRVREAVKALI